MGVARSSGSIPDASKIYDRGGRNSDKAPKKKRTRSADDDDDDVDDNVYEYDNDDDSDNDDEASSIIYSRLKRGGGGGSAKASDSDSDKVEDEVEVGEGKSVGVGGGGGGGGGGVGISGSGSDSGSGRKKEARSNTLTVASINVEMYHRVQGRTPENMGREIAKRFRLAHEHVDVVCVQEDLALVPKKGGPSRPLLQIPGYKLVVHCIGERIDGEYHLCNSTFVNEKVMELQHVSEETDALAGPGVGASAGGDTDTSTHTFDGHGHTIPLGIVPAFVPRCASVCTVKGVRIANVHLSGGRFDDVLAHEAEDIKAAQLERVLKEESPDIVIGDFNGSPAFPDSMRAYVDTRLPPAAKGSFPKFFSSGHSLLGAHGYTAVLREDGLPYVTSIFDTSPDWIYFSRRVLQGVVGHLRRVDFTSSTDGKHMASDHDALLATFLLSRRSIT